MFPASELIAAEVEYKRERGRAIRPTRSSRRAHRGRSGRSSWFTRAVHSAPAA